MSATFEQTTAAAEAALAAYECQSITFDQACQEAAAAVGLDWTAVQSRAFWLADDGCSAMEVAERAFGC